MDAVAATFFIYAVQLPWELFISKLIRFCWRTWLDYGLLCLELSASVCCSRMAFLPANVILNPPSQRPKTVILELGRNHAWYARNRMHNEYLKRVQLGLLKFDSRLWNSLHVFTCLLCISTRPVSLSRKQTRTVYQKVFDLILNNTTFSFENLISNVFTLVPCPNYSVNRPLIFSGSAHYMFTHKYIYTHTYIIMQMLYLSMGDIAPSPHYTCE